MLGGISNSDSIYEYKRELREFIDRRINKFKTEFKKWNKIGKRNMEIHINTANLRFII